MVLAKGPPLVPETIRQRRREIKIHQIRHRSSSTTLPWSISTRLTSGNPHPDGGLRSAWPRYPFSQPAAGKNGTVLPGQVGRRLIQHQQFTVRPSAMAISGFCLPAGEFDKRLTVKSSHIKSNVGHRLHTRESAPHRLAAKPAPTAEPAFFNGGGSWGAKPRTDARGIKVVLATRVYSGGGSALSCRIGSKVVPGRSAPARFPGHALRVDRLYFAQQRASGKRRQIAQ